MNTYTITNTAGQIRVNFNGTAVELKPMFSFSKPLYAFGEHSDASINLAYSILSHCFGEGEASLLSHDFEGHFLSGKKATPFDISYDEIKSFVELAAKSQFEAQDIIRKMKPC